MSKLKNPSASQEMATYIANCLGGIKRLQAFTGANLVIIDDGLRITFPNKIRIEITYYYDFFKMSVTKFHSGDPEAGKTSIWKVMNEQKEIYFDQLKTLVEENSGYYLSLGGESVNFKEFTLS